MDETDISREKEKGEKARGKSTSSEMRKRMSAWLDEIQTKAVN